MFEALLSNRTVSVLVEALPRILTAGLTMTIPLTLLSFFFAMIIAVAVALVQYANVPVLRQIARFYIWVIRGTPLLVQLFIIFYGLPSVGIMLNAFPAAVIAFAFNEGAYCAETMRGALESVPQGQLEAGYCVGMSWWQIMRRIVLPQALRTAVPALSNSLIGMIKDTSLASNITVAELFMAGQRVAARTYIFLPIYCEVAVVYLLFCTVITKLQSLLEIPLEYPVNAMTRVCKKLSLPKKEALEAIAMYEMAYGGGPATAHDVFMAMQEIPYMMKTCHTREAKLLKAEENMARALSIRWSDYDVAKELKW